MTDITILIAEDDEALADLWQVAFAKDGYAVNLAHDGQQAIDWLHTNPLPDVLIVDYNMPFANGMTVLRELAKLDGADAVTTVMVTANPFAHTDDTEDNIDMLLQKPVSFRDMRILVERLTQHARR